MKRYLAAVGFGLLLAVALAPARAVAEDIDAKVRALTKQYGRGSDDDLRLRLIDLGDQDSVVRRYDMDRLNQQQQRWVMEQVKATDKQLTAQLREIVTEKGWPTLKMVGVQASEDAARVLLHSPDRDFQRRLTPTVEKLADAGEIIGTNIAPLVDQLLVEQHKPQRFGTHYTVQDGKVIFDPIDDPDKLDERRAAWFLPPMEQFKHDLELSLRLHID